MRKARLIAGRTAVGILVIAGGTGATQGAPASEQSRAVAAAGDLTARSVAKELAGEWDGQIEVRGSSGALSTSLVSMSARMAPGGESLELYYEGFAFGKPVEGAIVLSFGNDSQGVTFRDRASGLQATCSPSESSDGKQLALSGSSAKNREVRTVFERANDGAWNIAYQVKNEDGDWSPAVSMSVHRLGKGQRSAAADNFSRSNDLVALRSEHATASADSDE
jgi:hypothetical protein